MSIHNRWSRKKSFVNDIEQFWRKVHDASGVKNSKLFEGVSPSSCNLARRVMNPKIVCGASKIELFTSSSIFQNRINFVQKKAQKEDRENRVKFKQTVKSSNSKINLRF